MPLQDVLAGVPGLAGYLGRQQFDQQQQSGQMQQLLSVINMVEQGKQRQQQGLLQQAQLAQLQEQMAMRRAEVERQQTARTNLGGAIDQLYPGKPAQVMQMDAADNVQQPASPAIPNARAGMLKGMVDLDQGGISDVMRGLLGMQGYGAGGAGAAPMLTKLMNDKAAAIAAGAPPEVIAQYDQQIQRMAAGYNQVQLGQYQGQGFNQAQRNADLADRGVAGLPVPGSQPLPGSAVGTPAQQAAPQVVPQPSSTGILPPAGPDQQMRPGVKTQRQILLDERAAEAAKGNAENVAVIDRELVRLGGAPQSAQPSTETTAATKLSARDERQLEAANRKEMYQVNVKQYDAFRGKLPELNASIRALTQLNNTLNTGATFSNAGAALKMQVSSLAQAAGIPFNIEELGSSEKYVAQIAELLKARLASKDYGAGTGVSNLDLIAAALPLPELAKSEDGKRKIIQALASDALEKRNDINAYRSWFDSKNGDMREFQFPSEAISNERLKQIQQQLRPGEVSGQVRQGGGGGGFKFLGIE